MQSETFYRQECIPVGCVLPAAVAIWGALHQAPLGPGTPPPRTRPPRIRHPPSGTRHPPEPGTPLGPDPPGTRDPRDQAPPGTRHPPCGQTHTCKHIILPQTSFMGGNNVILCTLYQGVSMYRKKSLIILI